MATFKTEGRLNHPELLRGEELRFDARWPRGSFLQLELSLYGKAGAGHNANVGIGITAMIGDDRIWLSNRGGARAAMGFDVGHPAANAPRDKASFRFVTTTKELIVLVNDVQAYKVKLRPGESSGRAFSLNVSDLNPRQGTPHLLVLENFEVRKNVGSRTALRVNPKKKKSILTVPRIYRQRPPTHVIVAKNGDLVRGRLTTLTPKAMLFMSRMDDFTFPRDRVLSIIWLYQDEMEDAGLPSSAVEKNAVRLVLAGRATVTLVPKHVKDKKLVGESPVLGRCEIPIEFIRELHLGDFVQLNGAAAYADWKPVAAPEPKFADNAKGSRGGGTDSGTTSPLIGTTADDFSLPTLTGDSFRLSDHKGKVVVLDFWATWCGPCLQAMPGVMKAVESFDPDEIAFIALNQQENKEQVADFVQTREWKMIVGLDAGNVAQQFQVNGIPQTVIIDKDRTIKFLHVGSSPHLEEQLRTVIAGLLAETTQHSSDSKQSTTASPDDAS